MVRYDLTLLIRLYARWRLGRLEQLDPAAVQERELLRLVRTARDTRFGLDHGFASVRSVSDFQARVPLRTYEQFWTEYLQPKFPVLDNVSWPGRVPFWAVSSGTTSGKTKYIPLTPAMRRSNVRAGLDTLCFHARAMPESRFFGGKSFMLGGSTDLVEEAAGVFSGDLSGIAAKTLPRWAAGYAFPPPGLTYLTDWEEKVAKIAEASLSENIRVLTGTPSWVLILLDHVAKLRAARSECTLYPELRLFIHGGVNFAPYRQRFLDLFAGQKIDMREVYPASEGFIAIADRGYGDGLKLSLDNGLFFEFVPLEELGSASPTRHWVKTAEPGVNYAVVMSTCAGLFSYVIGDTIRFVDTATPRLLITGRTSYMMSAFGEHLIGEEIERAVSEAASALGLVVTDYSAGAEYPKGAGELGGHLYVVELNAKPPPGSESRLARLIDASLQAQNDDYRAHRAEGYGLKAPEIVLVPPGFFASWMKSRGRLGGQNKVPRVINDETLWSGLKAFVSARQSSAEASTG